MEIRRKNNEKYELIVKDLKRREYVSASSLQREYGLGFPSAARILAALQDDGLIAREQDRSAKGYRVLSNNKKNEGKTSSEDDCLDIVSIDPLKDASIFVKGEHGVSYILAKKLVSVLEKENHLKVRKFMHADEETLDTIIEAMEHRLSLFAESEVNNIDGYNQKEETPLPIIFVEASCFNPKGEDLNRKEIALSRLLAKGKPAGIRIVYSHEPFSKAPEAMLKFTDKVVEIKGHRFSYR